MQLFALTRIDLGPDADGLPISIPAETEFTLDDVAEGERLIAIGAAVNPEQRIITASVDMGADRALLLAERDELLATLADARSANEEFNEKHTELTASLSAAQAEIDRLTKALAAAEKKAK